MPDIILKESLADFRPHHWNDEDVSLSISDDNLNDFKVNLMEKGKTWVMDKPVYLFQFGPGCGKSYLIDHINDDTTRCIDSDEFIAILPSEYHKTDPILFLFAVLFNRSLTFKLNKYERIVLLTNIHVSTYLPYYMRSEEDAVRIFLERGTLSEATVRGWYANGLNPNSVILPTDSFASDVLFEHF